jgi:hypothetical protein
MKQTKIGPGSKVVYEWTEGPFAGYVFDIDLLADGKLKWQSVDGAGNKDSAIEDTYSVRELIAGVTQIAWLEAVGYTINVTVIPEHWAVPQATAESFDAAGDLRDPTGQAMVRRVGVSLASFLGRLAD